MTPLGILIVALLVVVGGVLALKLHPFLILIIAAFVVALLTPNGDAALAAPGQRVAEGFGKTALDIGIVIAMASILGTCLSAAGGAPRIVVSIQRFVGERHTPLALLLADRDRFFRFHFPDIPPEPAPPDPQLCALPGSRRRHEPHGKYLQIPSPPGRLRTGLARPAGLPARIA
jgi:hypothetical protein